MNRSTLLTVDGIVNLALGLLLMLFPAPLIAILGIPDAPAFYPNILGGVLFGIGVALFLERTKRLKGSGLGLAGAVAINLCGAVVLAAWLLFGDLGLPFRGSLLLWGLVILLVGVSSMEMLTRREDNDAVAT